MRSIAIGFCALALSAPLAGAQQSLQSSSAGPTVESQAGAQAVPSAVGGAKAQAAPAGPTIESAAVGFRANANKNESVEAAQIFRRGQGQDVALMVVGVGAMIVGAIIGDTAGTVILIGGAAMALFGLYNYLE